MVCGLHDDGLRMVEQLHLAGVPSIVVNDAPDLRLPRCWPTWGWSGWPPTRARPRRCTPPGRPARRRSSASRATTCARWRGCPRRRRSRCAQRRRGVPEVGGPPAAPRGPGLPRRARRRGPGSDRRRAGRAARSSYGQGVRGCPRTPAAAEATGQPAAVRAARPRPADQARPGRARLAGLRLGGGADPRLPRARRHRDVGPGRALLHHRDERHRRVRRLLLPRPARVAAHLGDLPDGGRCHPGNGVLRAAHQRADQPHHRLLARSPAGHRAERSRHRGGPRGRRAGRGRGAAGPGHRRRRRGGRRQPLPRPAAGPAGARRDRRRDAAGHLVGRGPRRGAGGWR
ncbi:MAG: hypothetical protein JWR90_2698 [Marmoricola sp.]|nr:hypothetical protein [Marmoricola sp.]